MLILSLPQNIYLIFSMEIIDDASSKNCIESSTKKISQNTPKGLKAVPIALVLATLGTDVRLPCHFCNERTGLSGRIWHRRSLHGIEKEIELDMHDNPTKNRVFVAEDHSLVIRKVIPKDGAYYFCYDVEDNATAKMDILLDIGYRITMDPHVLDSPDNLEKEVGKWLETCQKLKEIPSVSQYVCYAEWGSWSRCDTCEKVGQRRRVAECRLQKFVKAQMETPQGNVIEADFPIVGVGCHSVLLNDVPAAKEILNKIPNIVILEKCKVSCEGFATKASRLKAFKKSSYLKKIKMTASKQMKEVGLVIKAEIKEEKEGATLTLFCPGASLDSKVKWKFNERQLKPEKLKRRTAGRVYIDATDVLHIKALRIKDSGEYICTLYDTEIGLVRLKVISKYTAFDPTTNFGILTITMILSFILWSVLMSVRWKIFMMQRKVQQMRGQRVLEKKVNETSGTESESLLDSCSETNLSISSLTDTSEYKKSEV